jgi:thiol-disulfide isomerase/thioredoxin
LAQLIKKYMKQYNLTLFIVLISAFFLFGCSGEESSESAPNTPEGIVENAIFADLDGNEVSIKDFKGSLVLIDFWESWCGPCLQVFPAMEDLRQEFPDKFQVLAVTVGLNEGPEDARKFAEEHGYDFHFLYDENEIFSQLGGQGIPFKAYVDPDGNFIKIEMGSYGRQGDYDRAKELITEYFGE